jgi:hypothetical protein
MLYVVRMWMCDVRCGWVCVAVALWAACARVVADADLTRAIALDNAPRAVAGGCFCAGARVQALLPHFPQCLGTFISRAAHPQPNKG